MIVFEDMISADVSRVKAKHCNKIVLNSAK